MYAASLSGLLCRRQSLVWNQSLKIFLTFPDYGALRVYNRMQRGGLRHRRCAVLLAHGSGDATEKGFNAMLENDDALVL